MSVKRRASIARTLVLGLLFVGCFGLAHSSVQMPPLLVQGVLLDADGRPVMGEKLTIALSDYYAQPETLGALASGALDPSAHAYRFCAIESGPQGEFACRLDGERRYIGFMPPFMCPGESTLRSFLVGVRSSDGSTFTVDVSGDDAEVRVPVGPESELTKPDDLPYLVEAAPSRSPTADVLQLVIRRKPAT